MTQPETNRINRLLALIAVVAALMAFALPGESAKGSSGRQATVALEPSAEEAGDRLISATVARPLPDSTAISPRRDSSRVGRAPFYGGSPVPLVAPQPRVKRPRRGTADSSAADSTKAESSMEGLVCFQ